MTILDRYFELSDLAGTDESAFAELVELFAEDAVLRPAGQDEVRGREAIRQFFDGFLKNNVIMKHVWRTEANGEDGLQTVWAVAGQRKSGDIFAIHGVDTAQLDTYGNIRSLEVRFAN